MLSLKLSWAGRTAGKVERSAVIQNVTAWIVVVAAAFAAAVVAVVAIVDARRRR